MSPQLQATLCQINPTVGDLRANSDLILDAAHEAASRGSDLIVFPELALTGYPPEDLLLNSAFVDAAQEELGRLTPLLPNQSTVAVGTVTRAEDGGLHNSLAVVQEGRVVTAYAKCRLPNYGVFDEQRYFVPGSGGSTIDVGGVKVGLSICEDIWFAGAPTAELAAEGAQLIVNASASPFHATKSQERVSILRERALEHGIPIAYCALVGGQDELVFDGESLVVDGGGEVVGRAPAFASASLDLDFSQSPVSTIAAPLSAVREIEEALRLGLHDYVTKNGFNGIVLGLSGGIDSAVVATLAVDALGPERVHAAVMPSPWSSAETQNDARELAANLGIELFEFEIDGSMGAWEAALGDAVEGPGSNIARENIQARIRGNLLMGLSNVHGWLVVTTGNKSELAVGYSTLYGDAAGGFGLLKDVPKGSVYALARLRNERLDSPIPSGIIDRPPSAELRPGQKDEDSLPPYDRLDEILRMHIEERRDVGEIVASGFKRDEVEHILKLVDRSEYKRRQYPPGVKITPLAFGRDRRMPMTNRWRFPSTTQSA